MLRAAIFDMDGLLIDSEPLWRAAEVEVFRTVGLVITEADCVETTGLRIDEVVAHWHAKHPWAEPPRSVIVERIVDRLIALVTAHGAPLPGVAHALAQCRARGLRLALASSSPRRIIAATLDELALSDAFEVIASAEDDRYGKPHPAVFLRCAELLGVAPTECLVFEDSLNGVIAAKAARMTCVAVPERPDARFAIADRVLGSLADFDWI
ncbi:MAG: hexitol phosphatase HxpB [Sandaracinaceae bacterium]|nr:hexitol phosphatase HxpB [Sandaracinaceae bacterium]